MRRVSLWMFLCAFLAFSCAAAQTDTHTSYPASWFGYGHDDTYCTGTGMNVYNTWNDARESCVTDRQAYVASHLDQWGGHPVELRDVCGDHLPVSGGIHSIPLVYHVALDFLIEDAYGNWNERYPCSWGWGPQLVENCLPDAQHGGVLDGYWPTYCMIDYGCSTSETLDPKTGFCISPAERNAISCPLCQRTAHPINLGSGNEHEAFTDYRSGGPFPLQFERSYNSAIANQPSSPDAATEHLGIGWATNVGGHLFIRSMTLASPGAAPGPCVDPDTNKQYFCPPGGSTPNTAYEVETILWRADGSQALFQYLNDGSGVPASGTLLTNESGTDGQLFYAALPAPATDTGFRYVGNDGYAELYDSSGRLLSVTNPDGFEHVYSYDSAGNVASVTDQFGRQLIFTHDGDNRITTMTVPGGGVYRYNYDVNGNLESVQYPDNSTIQYLYENATFPHALTGTIDANGDRYATWHYDSKGRAEASNLAHNADNVRVTYNSDGSTDITEATGLVRHMQFTTVNFRHLMSSVSAPCPECGDDTKSISYDANGFLSSTTDFDGNATNYTHDSSGLELSRTEAAGTQDERTVTTQWDTVLREPTLVTEPGKSTTYAYDSVGRMLTKAVTDTSSGIVRTTSYSYNGDGLLANVTDPLGHVTQFAYDTQGNLASITNALGQVTRITQYDASGYPLTIIDPNGVETDLVYDARQRLVSRTIAGQTTGFDYDAVGDLVKVTLPTGAYLQYGYDAAHRLTGIADNLGNQIIYTLDTLGNRTNEQTSDSSGAITRTLKRVYNALNQLQQSIGGAGQITQYTDDLMGNPITITDPMGHVTHQLFDPLNRLMTVADPENGNTTYNHDALDHTVDVADPKGLDTHYTYDAFGDVLQQVSPDTGSTAYTYDLDGNRVTKTDANGVVTTYAYDALNRLTGITYPDSAENVTYGYDQGANGIGRLTTIVDQSGSTAYQYDSHGNVIGKTVTVDGHILAVGYQYDAADQLTGISYPSGMVINYQRDAAERVTSVTLTQNGMTQTVAAGISYNPFGPIAGLTYGNGLTETRTYDQDYRLTSISVPGIEQWALTHDADDDITAIGDLRNSANSQTFGYDDLGRLNSAQGSYGTLGYAYDLDGNRTRLTVNGTASAYDYDTASNHLLSVASAQTYGYDANGNTINDGTHTYAYNNANRLTGYDDQSGVYLYNGLGQRVRKPSPVIPGDANGDGVIDENDLHSLQDALKGNVPVSAAMDCNQDGVVDNKDKSCIANQIGDTKNQGKGKNANSGATATAATTAGASSQYIYFVYDEAGHLIGEYDQSGSPIEEHVWLGNRPLAVSAAAGLYYVTTDQLDTPRAITDQNKALVWQWASDPFGSGTPTGSITYNLRFPGQYYDAETGKNYNYFRDYDPTTGRYIESDPIGLSGGINTYAYVGSNPVRFSDPVGLLNPGEGACVLGPNPVCDASVVTDIITTVGGLYALHEASKAKQCKDNVRCEELEAEIADLASQLRARYLDALKDKHDLYNKAYNEPNLGRRKGSYRGHRIQFQELQKTLREKIDEALALGCHVNADDIALANSPYPANPAAR